MEQEVNSDWLSYSQLKQVLTEGCSVCPMQSGTNNGFVYSAHVLIRRMILAQVLGARLSNHILTNIKNIHSKCQFLPTLY